jgi:hypothetical protein
VILAVSCLVAVQSRVRPFEYLEARFSRRPFRHPHRPAHYDTQLGAGKIKLVGPKDPGTHALYLDPGVGKASVHHHHEFITTPSAEDVLRARSHAKFMSYLP